MILVRRTKAELCMYSNAKETSFDLHYGIDVLERNGVQRRQVEFRFRRCGFAKFLNYWPIRLHLADPKSIEVRIDLAAEHGPPPPGISPWGIIPRQSEDDGNRAIVEERGGAQDRENTQKRDRLASNKPNRQKNDAIQG